MRLAMRALAVLGWVLLGVAAVAGVVLTVAYTAFTTDLGRVLVVPPALSFLEEQLAGRIQVGRLRVLPRGALELDALEIRDPDGERVLWLDRAVVTPDLSGLSGRTVGLRAEVQGLSVVLRREAGGGFSIARALSPRRPSPERTGPGGSTWTVRLSRLEIAGGEVRVVEPDGSISVAARDLALLARGRHGPRGGGLELRLRGNLAAPVEEPLSLDVAASLRDGSLRLPLAKAVLGNTALDLLAEANLAARRGRAALLALRVEGGEVARLVPRVPLAGEIGVTAYGESDGAVATAALEARSHGDGGATAAAAARLSGSPAVGFEVDLLGLDPARLLSVAPPAELHLAARGRFAGTDLDTLRGALALTLGRSRLRSGTFGPAELRAAARDGAVEISRLSAELPGATLEGRGSWRPRGAISGNLSAASPDLAALARNVAALAGRPPAALAGSLRMDAELSGTARAPNASATLSAPRLTLAGLDMRKVTLSGRVEDRAVDASLSAILPDVGSDPFAVHLSGRLADDLASLGLSELTLAWPGSRFALAAPARVAFAGPSVDRLEVASGAERIAVAGGRSGKEIDVGLEIGSFDLARLPAQLLPPRLGLGGRVSLSGRARGRASAPVASLGGKWTGGTAIGLSGLEADVDLHVDGPSGRAAGSLSGRAAGGELEIRADAPLRPAYAPRGAPIAFSAAMSGLELADAARAAGREIPLSGRAAVALSLEGTAGEPRLSGSLELDGVRYGPHGPLALRARLDDPGERARLSLEANDGEGAALEAEASLPLRLAELLRAPKAVGRALPRSTLEASLTLRALDLARHAGKGKVPEGLAGKVEASARLSGTLAAPRGRARLSIAGGALGGVSGLDAALELAARDAATEVSGHAELSGVAALALRASLGLPPEQLVDRRRAEAAALRVDVEIPSLDLARVAAPVPLAGLVEGKLTVRGSAGAPEAELKLGGRGLSADGRPIGDLSASARAGARGLAAEVGLDLSIGGRLRASLAADAPVTLAALSGGALRDAPARARLDAEAVDLRILPSLLPGDVRSASGSLEAALVAQGPLSGLEPRGTLRIAGGALAVSEYGEWTDIEVEAAVDDEAIRIRRLEARRGQGRLAARAETRGLPRAGQSAEFSGELSLASLAIPRGGQDVATVDLQAALAGAVGVDETRAEVTVSRGRVQLPKSLPRSVQSLEPRKDVVVGKPPKAPKPERPYRVEVHVVVPGDFLVKSELPRMDLEFKADTLTTWQSGGPFAAEGRVETIRGKVEPIPGRIFEIQRCIVRFTGADPESAQIDAVARYESTQAKVNVTVSGTAGAPHTDMTSEPSMDPAQIAMLLYTGRTDFKAGSGAASSLTGQDVGAAALGLVATQFLRDVVADKLPVDVVSLDSSQLRAGKYISEKVYVGYVRRYSAKLESGENANELRVEYQISRSFTFESSYGDANTGEADVIWSKDY